MGIRVEHHDTHTVLACRGRLDLAGVSELRAAVTNCLRAGPRILVLDMAGAEVTDASAIGALIACHRDAAAAGVDLRLARVPYRVQCLLAQASVGTELNVFGSVQGAVTGLAVTGLGSRGSADDA